MTVISGTTGIDKVQTGAIESVDLPAGSVIQVANYTTGTWASGTTQIPFDNTVPQITEGTQFMSLAFTPKKANSKLKIEVVGTFTASSGTDISMALFKDSDTNAIASTFVNCNIANTGRIMVFTKFIDAVDTSLHTFTVRAGAASAVTVYFNGYTAGLHGGSLASSITITEIAQ